MHREGKDAQILRGSFMETEPLRVILGGIVVAVASGVIGKELRGRGKVAANLWDERGTACLALLQ